jgi:hypothetical protein
MDWAKLVFVFIVIRSWQQVRCLLMKGEKQRTYKYITWLYIHNGKLLHTKIFVTGVCHGVILIHVCMLSGPATCYLGHFKIFELNCFIVTDSLQI